MFFVFNSLDYRTDITNHPKIHIIFNDVSRNEESGGTVTKGEDFAQDQIDKFKDEIKEEVKKFYLFEEISDNTKVGVSSKRSSGKEKKFELLEWKDVKNEVCGGESY